MSSTHRFILDRPRRRGYSEDGRHPVAQWDVFLSRATGVVRAWGRPVGCDPSLRRFPLSVLTDLSIC